MRWSSFSVMGFGPPRFDFPFHFMNRAEVFVSRGVSSLR
jgi:hypothetical protein